MPGDRVVDSAEVTVPSRAMPAPAPDATFSVKATSLKGRSGKGHKWHGVSAVSHASTYIHQQPDLRVRSESVDVALKLRVRITARVRVTVRGLP